MHSLNGIYVLVAFLCMGSVLSATLVYALEHDVRGTQFLSIPAAMWWSMATLTTVGYGDMTPSTICGKIVGAATMLWGVVIVSASVAVITTTFTEQYNKTINLQKIVRSMRKTQADLTYVD